mmetsp:Transcript_31614/g.71416  ORF Transcript_31614/g.71416 Transcript_31614/m.71416 type:complete len:245 (+) Transcript_31614:704-1438(+)
MVQDAEVVKLIAEVLREMVHGEVIQAKAKPQELLSFDHYLHKTYCKTAALIALSCEAVAVLGQQPHVVRVALKSYGRHLGIAYQLIDDLLVLLHDASGVCYVFVDRPSCFTMPAIWFSSPLPCSLPPTHVRSQSPPSSIHFLLSVMLPVPRILPPARMIWGNRRSPTWLRVWRQHQLSSLWRSSRSWTGSSYEVFRSMATPPSRATISREVVGCRGRKSSQRATRSRLPTLLGCYGLRKLVTDC